MRFVIVFMLWAAALAVSADELVMVCYNYGCLNEELVVFHEGRLTWAGSLLAAAVTPRREREYLSLVIGKLYADAGRQSPISVDRGGNLADGGEPGSMDCIDHSTTTTRFLQMIERRGDLRFHRVGEIVSRPFLLVSSHFAASIEDKVSGERFAVDSWFVDNGEPAVILPLVEWEDGGGPDV